MGWRPYYLLAAIALLGPGCASDTECSSDSDCPGGEVCRSNRCAEPATGEGEEESCRQDTDCDAPLVCDRATGRCTPPETFDLGFPREDTGPVEDLGNPTDIQDHASPEVVRTSPAEGDRNVPITTTVQVVFSEPVKESIVEAPAITLHNTMDPEGTELPATVEWDLDTLTATVTPRDALWPYTTYKVVVSERIKDEHGNFLVEFPDFFFTTAVDADAEAHYLAIAQQYAPVVFQETNRQMVQADWLAPYDFDGAWQGERKRAAWRAKKDLLQGTLYWNVTETKSHYFVTYAHYHPFDYDQSSVEAVIRENGMAGAQVIVAKDGAHAGWLAVEVYVGDQFWSFTVDGKGITARPGAEGGINEFKGVMPAEWLIDDARYQSFIPFGTHESCVWGRRSAALDLHCMQTNAGAFYQSSGLHYVPGDDASGDIPVAAPTACEEGCPAPGEHCVNGACTAFRYGMRSLAAELWIRRHEFARYGETIWSGTPLVYEPLPADQRRPGAGMRFPLAFAGAPDNSPGQPPWAWDDRDDSEVARGQWFLDPAYSLNRHLKPAEGDRWSTTAQDYCWNIYLGIFRWKDPGCSGAPAAE